MNAETIPADYHPWSTTIHAREEARRRGDRRIGTEHLILGLMHEPGMEQYFAGRDIEDARAALAELDREALGAAGVDASIQAPPVPSAVAREVPRRPSFKAVLRDRLPLTPRAKAALRATEKDTRRRGRSDPRKVLAALLALDPPDPAAQLLQRLELDRDEMRATLDGPR